MQCHYRTAKCYATFHLLNEELHAHEYSLESETTFNAMLSDPTQQHLWSDIKDLILMRLVNFMTIFFVSPTFVSIIYVVESDFCDNNEPAHEIMVFIT